jgi:parvulin-like peptidyl-prolyl isomerase
LAIAALGVVAATATSQTIDVSRTVATVNGEEVKGLEYYRRMEFLIGVGKPVGGGFFEATPGFLTLDQLITERLILQLARQKGAFPADAEIDAEVRNRIEDNPSFVEQWTALGRTMDELRYQIRLDLAQFKIQTFGITITDQEIDQHYRDNGSMYTIPKQAELRVIVVNSETLRDVVDRELGSGKAFPDVAREHSIDLSKLTGGNTGKVPISAISEPARSAIEGTRIGSSTDWISTTFDNKPAFIKFQVVDISAERKLELDAKLRRSIRKRLMEDKGRVRNNIQAEMSEMRKKANIDIKDPIFQQQYKEYIESLLRQGG